MSALYVYALTNGSAAALHHGNHRIEFVAVSGIHAAVERVAGPPAISEQALREQHEIVLKIAQSVDAIVPARFGASLDRQELETLVAMRIDAIKATLALVAGRVQMTVRIFTSEGRAAAGKRVVTGSGTTYLHQRRRPRLTGPAATISRTVRGLVHEERTRHRQGHVDWTLYHLVDRDAVPQYTRALQPFESEAVVVSGPWPPFAFVPDLWP